MILFAITGPMPGKKLDAKYERKPSLVEGKTSNTEMALNW